MKSKTVKPLLVTTAHRGVFFGYGVPTDAQTITIEHARMAVYWSPNVHGVMGLASNGPDNQCRIGPAVPKLTLQSVTAVIEVSDDACRKWEAEPWN